MESKYGNVKEDLDEYWLITVRVSGETVEKALATATGYSIVHVDRYEKGEKICQI